MHVGIEYDDDLGGLLEHEVFKFGGPRHGASPIFLCEQSFCLIGGEVISGYFRKISTPARAAQFPVFTILLGLVVFDDDVMKLQLICRRASHRRTCKGRSRPHPPYHRAPLEGP